MQAALTKRLKREMAQEKVRLGVPADFPDLPDILSERYTDPTLFALEQDRVWARSWLLVGHASELPETGSYLLSEDAGAPVVIVRGEDGGIRAFYNACQHRGAAVVQEPSGCVKAFKCPYHAWVYGLDGRLRGRPDEEQFAKKADDVHLKPVRCEAWGGWIFVNRDAEAQPLLETLGTIPEEMDDFRIDELCFVNRQSMILECNWKVVIEAFLEVYHLDHIHPYTAGALLDHAATTIALKPGGHSRMVTRKREGQEETGFHGPGMEEIPGIGEIPRTTSYSYHFFPNVITPLDIKGFPFLIAKPIDVRTTRLDICWYGPRWSGERPEGWDVVFQLFDLVMAEDTRNLASIQKSIESDGFTKTRLCYPERRIYYLHQSIDRLIGEKDVPARLRVPPLLDGYVEW